MPLVKLPFKPGVNKERTALANEGQWYDCDKVRFRQGFPEKIGGWLRVTANTFVGTCRALINWVILAGSNYIGVGTTHKYYVLSGESTFNDITPFIWPSATLGGNPFATTNGDNTVTVTHTTHGLQTGNTVIFQNLPAGSLNGIPTTEFNQYLTITRIDANSYTVDVTSNANASTSVGGSGIIVRYTNIGLGSDPITTTNGSGIITVAHTSHAMSVGQYFVMSGATAVNGITTAQLNKEHTVTSVVNANSYTVTTTGTANASSTGGGTAVQIQEEINTGLDVYVGGLGWGAGAFSRGTWGSAITPSSNQQLTLWSNDNFGEDLFLNLRYSGYYYWDATGGVASRAVPLDVLPGADEAPTVGSGVLVTDNEFAVAWGCNQLDAATQDPLFVRWADQSTMTDWNPESTNAAGGQRLAEGTEIIAAEKVRQEVLLWTDTALYSMQYIGQDLVFGFQLMESNCSIAGPNVAVSANNVTYWMGANKFYLYDGRVRTLPCDLHRHIFQDMNTEQRFKFCAGTIEKFNEVIWFYCSNGSSDIDRYVIYNYGDNIWYPGTLERTAWLDAPILGYPIAAADGLLYYHENGYDDDNDAMEAYITSGDIDLGDGDRFAFIKRVIPDLTFEDSTTAGPFATLTIEARNTSGSSYADDQNADNTGTVIRTATSPVEQYTTQVWVRIRGRQFRFTISSSDHGVAWQLGTPRVEVQPDGRR